MSERQILELIYHAGKMLIFGLACYISGYLKGRSYIGKEIQNDLLKIKETLDKCNPKN